MVRLGLLLALFLTGIAGRAAAQQAPQLAARIDSLARTDQKARNRWVQLQNTGAGPAALQEARAAVQAADSLHLPELRAIVRHFGYPGYRLADTAGSNNFWLLVQHADNAPGFQDSVLALMKKAVQAGDASATNYAYLRDRVNDNMGKPQVYGTQMRVNAEGTSFEPLPVDDTAGLDARRKSVGLAPMAQYIRTMNETYPGALRAPK